MAVQVQGEVLSIRKVGAYFSMTVIAPGMAGPTRPGHFVAVQVGGPESSMLLRRAFAIYDVKERGVYGGTVEFIFAVHGKGTAWLASRRPQDKLDLVGPLGKPFGSHGSPVTATLVGGGYGSAPLLPLATMMRERGCRVDFVLGAANVDQLFGQLDAKRIASSIEVTTDDGSMGHRGRVSDVLPELLDRTRSDVVYACGPMGMLRAVSDLAAERGIPAQVAVEESMACGIGVCMTCVLPVIGDDGVTRMVRSCVEGPVFLGDRIRWDDVGTVPLTSSVRSTPRRSMSARSTSVRSTRVRCRRGCPLMSDLTVRSAAVHAPAPQIDMTTELAGVSFPNPVFTASGCAAAGQELDHFFDITLLGGVVTKSIMLAPRSGRATPRMAETPSGMLNSIGLQGPGIDAFLDKDLAWLAKRGARAVVSIAGGCVEDYTPAAQKLREKPGLAMIEVNISCPNVENRGQVFACDPRAAASVVSAVKRATAPGIPVFAKLSPDVTDITEIARACVDAGADGLSMINTLLGMVIDTTTMRPALGGVTGGLSGPAIRPVAVRCVWQIRQALPDIAILGMGGIRTGLDALEFVLAGANAVSVGTTVFGDPTAPIRVLDELARALAERGFERFRDAVGVAHRPPVAYVPEDPDPVGDEPFRPPSDQFRRRPLS